jgi:hypothetical protein
LQRIIIIGAGPAGLTAAYDILKQSDKFEVYILDENENVGGISRTINYKGNRMDIGGHRFFSKEEAIIEWWNDIIPRQSAPAYDDKILGRRIELSVNGTNPEKEDCVMLLRKRVSRIFYNGTFFDYPITMNIRTFINMGFFQTVKVAVNYLFSCFQKLPEASLENFYINRFGKVLYSMFFENYTEKVWGRHPREISSDWGKQRVKGLTVWNIIKDTFFKRQSLKGKQKVESSLIKEFLYPKYGPGQLWETVAGKVEDMGGKIIRNACVNEIHVQKERVKGLTYLNNSCYKREYIEGDIFISSMPLKDLAFGIGERIPDKIYKIAEGLKYRDFVTIGILVEKLKIKNLTNYKTLNNIIPDCWIYVQETGVKLGRIQIFNNWSPYLVKDVDSKIWIGLEYFCQEGDDFWNLSESDSADFAIEELLQIGILEKKEDVLDYHREKIRKAYPAYFDTYKDIDKLIQYLNHFENLYCIGRNGQHRYNNMDHSMLTAFEAVSHIINNKKSKKDIWNVNTELEYHEEKKQK